MKTTLNFFRNHALFILGGALTATYLWGIVWLRGWPNAAHWREMAPNTFGDAVAGTAGPLALLWVVLGFLQQGKELRQSGEALRMQADELQAAVDQHKEMVKATRDSLDFERTIHQEAQKATDEARWPRFHADVPLLQAQRDRYGMEWWGSQFVLTTGVAHDVSIYSDRDLAQGEIHPQMMLVGDGFYFRWMPRTNEGAFPESVNVWLVFTDEKERRFIQTFRWVRLEDGNPALAGIKLAPSTKELAEKIAREHQIPAPFKA
ncbi:hypothetical protein [Luteolibacter luteus]|uniref:Uncharacterized protein n=1 Tax=Luteolibacter luteus TaxID=2728835 RepID=A0A858RMQ7_9BACT|nr:hypothetical protein [Luteolibacter luteus]QJE97995.1 hypothetical protein HHL09_20115 [Luteolibacter luteus]